MTKGALALGLAALVGGSAAAAEEKAAAGKRFEWTTTSAQAKQDLLELQTRIENFQFGPQNVELAQKTIRRALATLGEPRTCSCASALKDAIITDKSRIPKKVRAELRPIRSNLGEGPMEGHRAPPRLGNPSGP